MAHDPINPNHDVDDNGTTKVSNNRNLTSMKNPLKDELLTQE